ncbi:MAG: hypothetical protein KAX51_15130, partial [Chromatiaceae bacterium]|nr:hypothetical protein [Chromatiaceae bacterium]MBP8283226.1 hypothetical protein [Chromatiaceae bacterium]MBP8291112.1 hypothetical protein [Chromatiaceae bacterium]
GRLIPSFQKVSGARRLARYLTRERNRSTSFQALMEGLEPLAAALSAGGEGRVSCVGRVSEA